MNSNAIGTIKIGHIDWKAKTADIGIMIGEKDYWNKGYATKVIKLIIMWWHTSLRLSSVTSLILIAIYLSLHCYFTRDIECSLAM